MALHRLAGIEIGIPETVLEATRAFHRELGLDETRPGVFATRDGGEQLRFVAASHRRLERLTIGVDDADDLERVAAALARLGVACERRAERLAAVEPSAELRVELRVEPRRKADAPAAPPVAFNGPGRTPRVDARSPAVLPTAERPIPRKLSHVVTTSPDAAAARRFFVEGIGLRVSDEIAGLGASFLRCSRDHHNLLIQPGPIAFVHHVAWEMDDVDAVGAGAAALVAADAGRHVWGLGRHGIGSNFFWYLRDPSGCYVELTSDLDVIEDEAAWRVASAAPVAGLAAWGPPVPRAFLAPDDLPGPRA